MHESAYAWQSIGGMPVEGVDAVYDCHMPALCESSRVRLLDNNPCRLFEDHV